MIILVTGGSGSGKSAYAEQRVQEFGVKKRFYVATMMVIDEEDMTRIRRHRAMRAKKNFKTIESPRKLEEVRVDPGSVVLLECMSNLVANEYFDGRNRTPIQVQGDILAGLMKLYLQCDALVIVTNEVFSDGRTFDEDTEGYLQTLAGINRIIGGIADETVEVVYGIPLTVNHHPEKEMEH